jgi:NAD(P)-dependent dehydrogenase (short-subunit alcohol dehydrogenase family)
VGTIHGPIDTLPIEEWDRVMGINLRGAFLVMRQAIPHLRAHGGGTITAIASVDGLVAETGLAAYCASKAGLINLVRTVALDSAREGIRVNAVCPSATDTPMIRSRMDTLPDGQAILEAIAERHPIRRLLDPSEIAATVAFLSSRAASGITGAAITVDLGLLAGWEAYRRPAWLTPAG